MTHLHSSWYACPALLDEARFIDASSWLSRAASARCSSPRIAASSAREHASGTEMNGSMGRPRGELQKVKLPLPSSSSASLPSRGYHLSSGRLVAPAPPVAVAVEALPGRLQAARPPL